MTGVTPEKNAVCDHELEQRELHGPAWRWMRAGEWLHRRPGPMQRRLGQIFLDVHHFRMLSAHSPVGRKQALALYPAIGAAEELNADPTKTDLLKIAILGEIEFGEVCPQLGVDEVVARAWEQTFFDVRGTRTAVGWVHVHLIKPELAAGRADLVARLRMAAALGMVGARAILKADARLPIREAEKWFDRQLRLSLKLDAAMEMTTDTNKTRTFFIRHHARLVHEEKRLKFAREKLEKKCAEALNRHELAKIHAEIALERARGRAAVRARQAEEVDLVRTGEDQSPVWPAAHRREQEAAEQTAMAARIAASPLSRLQWRHRQESGSTVRIFSESKHAEVEPPMIVPASVPLTILMPRSVESTFTRVSA